MKEIMFEFFKGIILICDTDPIKMFFFYGIWFWIAEFIIYSVEKIIYGKAVTVQWYDLSLLIFFAAMYAVNVAWLVFIIKRVG